MTLETIAILILAGIVGGAWNAVAGGATLFTFPALMLAGLPPVVANATNFLAMLPSNAAALPAYRQELKGVGREIWPLLLVSGAGAICGSCLLLISEPKTFVALVPFLLLAATSLFAFGGKIRGGLIAMLNRRSLTKPLYVVLFLSSIYGGYFGAGLGIILLAIVQIMGFTNFHVANSLKALRVNER